MVRKIVITISIHPDLNEALNRLKDETGMTKSLMVERGLKMLLSKYGKPLEKKDFGGFVREFMKDAE